MAEYIEREKALEECDWYANEFCECEYAIMPLKGALENLPAADVRPVVKARWKDHRTNEHDGEWHCSACGEEPWWCGVTEDILPPYCPNCGAMMEE